MALEYSPAAASTVPATTWTMASSGSDSASEEAVSTAEASPVACCARATIDLEAESLDDFSEEMTWDD